jgi:hypothetical protein
MEEWLSTDNLCIPLSDIERIKTKMFESYFQQGTESVGDITKEIWRFAIAGTADKGNLIKLAKMTINSKQWQTMLNLNYFPEINYYYAGWISGADLEGGSILHNLEKIGPKGIKLEEDKARGDLEPMFSKPSDTLPQRPLERKCHL